MELNKMDKTAVIELIATKFWRMFNEADGEQTFDPDSEELATAALDLLESLRLIQFDSNLKQIIAKLNENGTDVQFGPLSSNGVGYTYRFDELPEEKQLLLDQTLRS